MATLSKHGQEVGRYSTIRYTKAFFANGDVLINRGFGWKEFGHVKPGVDPRTVCPKVQATIDQKIKDHPIWAQYRKAIMEIPLSQRWKMITALEALGDDGDGIWSEVCDGCGDNISLSLDEVYELIHLRNAADQEIKSEKERE